MEERGRLWARMSYREHLPAPALAPFVDRFWTRASGGDERHERGSQDDGVAASLVLPDGCIDVIVRVDRGGEARVVGTMSQAVVSAAGAAQMAAVRFRPGGAAAMMGLAAVELTDRTEPLAALGAMGRELGAALEHTTDRGGGSVSSLTTGRALAAMERWMLGRLSSVRAPEPLVAHAVTRLFGAAAPSTSELAEELGVSRQHLRRLCLRHVGLAPKELGRVARLQRTVDHLQRFPAHELARAAIALGYFDQAHMARELRLLAGVSATQVRAQAGSIFPIRSLLGGAD